MRKKRCHPFRVKLSHLGYLRVRKSSVFIKLHSHDDEAFLTGLKEGKIKAGENYFDGF